MLNQPRCSFATWDSVTESRHDTHHTSHVHVTCPRHTSHVTRHTSHVTSHITRHKSTSHITPHTSTSHITRQTSDVRRHLLHEHGVVSLRSHGCVSQTQEGAKPGWEGSGQTWVERFRGWVRRGFVSKNFTALPGKPSQKTKYEAPISGASTYCRNITFP